MTHFTLPNWQGDLNNQEMSESSTTILNLEWTTTNVILTSGFAILAVIAPIIIRLLCRPVTKRAKATPGGLADTVNSSLRTPFTLLCEELLFILLLEVAPLPDATEGIFRPILWVLIAITGLWLTNNTVALVGRAFTAPAILSDSVDGDESLDDVSPILSRVLRGLVLGLIIALVMEAVGLSVTPLVTGLGIGGLIVGLAFQATLSNMLASASIISDRPFELGDYVEISGKLGTVESIGLRSTRIRALDGTLAVVPNSQLDSKIVVNLFRSTFTRWVWSIDVVVGNSSKPFRKFLQEVRGLVKQFPGMASDVDPYSAVYVKSVDGITATVEFKLLLQVGPLTDRAKCEALAKVYHEQIEAHHGAPDDYQSHSLDDLASSAQEATDALSKRSSDEVARVKKAGGGHVAENGGVTVLMSKSARSSVKVRASWAFWPPYLSFRELLSLHVMDALRRNGLESVVNLRTNLDLVLPPQPSGRKQGPRASSTLTHTTS